MRAGASRTAPDLTTAPRRSALAPAAQPGAASPRRALPQSVSIRGSYSVQIWGAGSMLIDKTQAWRRPERSLDAEYVARIPLPITTRCCAFRGRTSARRTLCKVNVRCLANDLSCFALTRAVGYLDLPADVKRRKSRFSQVAPSKLLPADHRSPMVRSSRTRSVSE
jgi:hypothetical protein